jgi:hypothetical protein
MSGWPDLESDIWDLESGKNGRAEARPFLLL